MVLFILEANLKFIIYDEHYLDSTTVVKAIAESMALRVAMVGMLLLTKP
jgi:hypothetical protein